MQPLRSFLFAPGKARASFGENRCGLVDDRLTRALSSGGPMARSVGDQAQLSAGVQNRTALADIAVKCSEKTARGRTIAAEFLAFRPRRPRNNSENSG